MGDLRTGDFVVKNILDQACANLVISDAKFYKIQWKLNLIILIFVQSLLEIYEISLVGESRKFVIFGLVLEKLKLMYNRLTYSAE
jgi:hypothetical protein